LKGKGKSRLDDFEDDRMAIDRDDGISEDWDYKELDQAFKNSRWVSLIRMHWYVLK
jgi:hypothetical protein